MMNIMQDWIEDESLRKTVLRGFRREETERWLAVRTLFLSSSVCSGDPEIPRNQDVASVAAEAWYILWDRAGHCPGLAEISFRDWMMRLDRRDARSAYRWLRILSGLHLAERVGRRTNPASIRVEDPKGPVPLGTRHVCKRIQRLSRGESLRREIPLSSQESALSATDLSWLRRYARL